MILGSDLAALVASEYGDRAAAEGAVIAGWPTVWVYRTDTGHLVFTQDPRPNTTMTLVTAQSRIRPTTTTTTH